MIKPCTCSYSRLPVHYVFWYSAVALILTHSVNLVFGPISGFKNKCRSRAGFGPSSTFKMRPIYNTGRKAWWHNMAKGNRCNFYRKHRITARCWLMEKTIQTNIDKTVFALITASLTFRLQVELMARFHTFYKGVSILNECFTWKSNTKR